jgi:hypothetical protein
MKNYPEHQSEVIIQLKGRYNVLVAHKSRELNHSSSWGNSSGMRHAENKDINPPLRVVGVADS